MNHCFNELEVSGPPASVDRFCLKAQGFDVLGEPVPMVFENFLPTPAHLLLEPDPSGAFLRPAWLRWRRQHWGCRVGPEPDTVVVRSPGRVTYCFSTPYTPPLALVDYASGLHPELRFEVRYAEPNMVFAGVFVCEAGEVVSFEKAEGDAHECNALVGHLFPVWDDDEDE